MRLRRKFAEGKLTDSELLELLLTYAIPRRDVKPIARALFAKYGGVHKILTASVKSLREISGIGESAATFIKALYELMLTDYKNYLKENPLLHDAKKLENYCRIAAINRKTEEFHVLYLDRDRRLLTDDAHAIGTIDSVAVYPREILRRALDINARFVVLAHNHPDGCSSFSTNDIKLTDEIRRMLAMVDVEVLDHLLISDGLVFSAKDLNWIK